MTTVVERPAFVPPASPGEALRRALVIIEQEQRWVGGSWFTLSPGGQHRLRDRLDRWRLRGREYPRPHSSCKDVKACAVAALMIACFGDAVVVSWELGQMDGPDREYEEQKMRDAGEPVPAYWNPSLWIEHGSVADQAVGFLSDCLPEMYRQDRSRLDAVTSFNDSCDASQSRASRQEHLKAIVNVFREAIKLADAASEPTPPPAA